MMMMMMMMMSSEISYFEKIIIQYQQGRKTLVSTEKRELKTTKNLLREQKKMLFAPRREARELDI